jgi:hypothetical protein
MDRLTPELEKIRMSLDELSETAACLGRAYHRDLMTTKIMPDPELRARALPTMLGFCLRYTYEFGHVFKLHDRSGKICGAVGIVPEEYHDLHLDRELELRLGGDQIVKTAGEEVSQKFDEFMLRVAEFRKDCFTRYRSGRRIYYCTTTGVEPAAMGHSTLVDVMTVKIAGCYYAPGQHNEIWGETWNPFARKVYEAMLPGTDIAAETTVFDIPIWFHVTRGDDSQRGT